MSFFIRSGYFFILKYKTMSCSPCSVKAKISLTKNINTGTNDYVFTSVKSCQNSGEI